MFIYQIKNIVTDDIYIGKTTKTVEERFARHISNSKTQNTYLYRAIRKYGKENFIVEIIETTENLDERERFWIATKQPRYNMTIGGDGGDTSKSPNYQTGMKRRRDMSGQNNPMFGKKRDNSAFLAKATESMARANKCAVVCEGTEYTSVGEAQKAYPGINIRKRLDNPRYPNFYRLRERTRRGASRG